MSVKKTFYEYLDNRKSALTTSSLNTYADAMIHFVNWCEERELTVSGVQKKHITAWATEVLPTMSARTLQWKLMLMKAFFAWGIRKGMRKRNPVVNADLPELRPVKNQKAEFTQGKYEQILAIAIRYGADYWPDAIRIAWATGLRMSDVASLTWKHVDLTAGQITIVPMKRQREGKPVVIPLLPEFKDHLLTLWGARGESDYVLPEFHENYLARRGTLSIQFGRLCERLDMKGHSFHSLRHGFVSRLLNAGVSSEVVRSMTGQSAETLHGYAHISMEAKRLALEWGRSVLVRKEEVA